jgi:SAM-dependent methyltransferase
VRDARSTNAAKYATRNPLARWLIRRFLDRAAARIEALAPASILDLGCGEGFVAERLRALARPIRYRGVDRSAEAIAAARARLAEAQGFRPPASGGFEVADALSADFQPERADLVLALEIIEHLAPNDAEALVARIAGWAPRALVSVPWEPWFRMAALARGRHLRRLGLHPEHVQQFTPRSLERLLARSFRAVRVERVFPWLLASVSEPLRAP